MGSKQKWTVQQIDGKDVLCYDKIPYSFMSNIDVSKQVSFKLNAYERLFDFANEVLEIIDHDSVDGNNLQDKALECGLLEVVEVKEPCGEDCFCESFHGEFPCSCLRKTNILTGV